MDMIAIGGRRYRLHTVERTDSWAAYIEREDTGDRFGPECTGSSEAEVVDRVSRWVAWQHEHVAALDALQSAERAYHRVVAGSAFSSETEAAAAAGQRKESLALLEAATDRLDRIRALGTALKCR